MPRGRKPQQRLPFAPVLELYPNQSFRGLADIFGVTWTAIRAWTERGVPFHRADEIAVRRMGVHPASVWGDDWWDATPLDN